MEIYTLSAEKTPQRVWGSEPEPSLHPVLGAEDAEGKEDSAYPHGAPTLEQGFLIRGSVDPKRLMNRLQTFPAHLQFAYKTVRVHFSG